jgi:hypothetical protein
VEPVPQPRPHRAAVHRIHPPARPRRPAPAAVYDTLDPLASLTTLQTLEFRVKRITDDRIEPLGHLTGLQKLTIQTNLFTTRQFAWLRARLPHTVTSPALAPVVHLRSDPDDHNDTDVALVGKRKPVLNSITHAARIKKHEDQYWQMVTEFQRNPALPPT